MACQNEANRSSCFDLKNAVVKFLQIEAAVLTVERETFGGEKVPAEQISPTGALLWPNGTPVLNTSGVLVDPDGNPMFDDTGHLVNKTLLESADASTSAPAS